MASKRTLTQQEVDRLKKKPLITVETAGKKYRGHYDEETQMFVETDRNGNLVGHAMRLNPEAAKRIKYSMSRDVADNPKRKGVRQSVKDLLLTLAGKRDDEDNSEDDADYVAKRTKKQEKDGEDGSGSNDTDREEKDENTENDKDDEAKKKRIFVIAAIIIVIISIFFSARIMFSGNDSQSEQQQTESAEQQKTVAIIASSADLIPGDQITEDNIKKKSISQDTYNVLSANGAKVYKWQSHESLIDMYVTEYIPTGEYLTYDNVDTVYTQPGNPWNDADRGYSYVTIPVNERTVKNLGYGSIINLTITKQTVNTEQGASQDALNDANDGNEITDSDAPGLKHSQSAQKAYIVDTYELSNVIVCDLLNENEDSLYSAYTSLMSIPAGEQASYLKLRMQHDDDFYSIVKPAFLSVKITTQQEEEIGSMDNDDTAVKISVTGSTDQPTDRKKSYAKKAQALMQNIYSVKTEIDKEAEEKSES